jgi:hypothetical protein
MTSPMDDALRRTTHAVEQYAVDPDMIALAAKALERLPVGFRVESEVRALTDAILLIAAGHGGPHESCDTCRPITNALAVAMGSIRAETDLTLRDLFERGEQ